MRYFLLFFTIATISCSNSTSRKKEILDSSAVSAINEPSQFHFIKSGVFWNELDEGTYGIVRFNDSAVDTVDKDFGVHILPDSSILYLKVSKYNFDEFSFKEDSIYGSIENYILWKNGTRSDLDQIALNLDNYFSSPVKTDDKLYYWGLEKLDSLSTFNIYASEFDLKSKKTIKHFLMKDSVETDFRGYFPVPEQTSDKVIFRLNDQKKWSFTKDFKLLN